MRDTWARLLKQAGWVVRIEQIVPTASRTKRADIAATSPAGEEIALDVMVTAPPQLHLPVGVHLFDAAKAKASRYEVLPGGRLPNGVQLIPLIHNAAVPFLDHHAMVLFQKLVAQASAREEPGNPAYWQPNTH